ncbi:MAG: putative 2OG-Fe(II) oxygenase [Sphingomicrobium sp.]
MPAPPLTAAETATLTDAVGQLQRGQARAAAEKLAPLIRGGCRDPDLLLTYSEACEQLGLLDEAARAVQLALQKSPEQAQLWARLGSLLEDLGRSGEGVTMLERAVALDAAVPAYWYNLGVAALSGGLLARAEEALKRVIEIDETNAAAWGALGLVQQQAGALDQSERTLSRALALDAASLTAAHNLAVTLRRLDRSAEALALIERAIGSGLAAPETELLRAHLLADLGRIEESVGAYRTIVADNPAAIEAHQILSRLLPQIGRGGEALDAYEEALRSAPTLELYRSSLRTACDLKDAAALERWSGEALHRFGDLPDLKMMHGVAHGLAGDAEKALKVLEPLIAGGFTPALTPSADYRLKLGDLRTAERHALAATNANFFDQAAWASLTVIWRLLDDPRERWLADYERFVMPAVLEPPADFDDLTEFMCALAEELTALHRTAEHPVDQSLRRGTQTLGNLFAKRSPLILHLAASIEQAIARAIDGLPADPTHPFLSRNAGPTQFIGSWSVRLRSGGFHVSHIHQEGWLSSAVYVALPPEVSTGSGNGALTFGIPPAELGVDLPPRRVEVPEVGRLVLFPSYFWHGTTPFESQDYRLTVAFDAIPA